MKHNPFWRCSMHSWFISQLMSREGCPFFIISFVFSFCLVFPRIAMACFHWPSYFEAAFIQPSRVLGTISIVCTLFRNLGCSPSMKYTIMAASSVIPILSFRMRKLATYSLRFPEPCL
ncbi:hypothetical protein L208DRAFT_1513776, partial [Tricholoma matsutake]